MKLFGKIWRDKDTPFWVVDIPSLDLSTQGESRAEAFEMAADAVHCLTDDPEFKVTVSEDSLGEGFYVEANNSSRLLGLVLQRNRLKLGLTYEETRELINAKSRSEFQTYEKGDTDPTLGKLERLLGSLGYDLILRERKPKKPA